MSRIAELEIGNYGPFRGSHRLRLNGLIYAVIAQHKKDPERSNALGKTSLMETIRFALYGVHRYRTEDEWITDGEDLGFVRIAFDNGAIVKRERQRGKSTKVGFFAGDKGYVKDEAEEAIVRMMGLTLADFEATSYLGQKKMARLILADPEDRMRIISTWLRLEPLKQAGSAASSRVGTLHDQVTVLSDKIRDCNARIARIFASAGVASTKGIESGITELDAEIALVNEELTEMRAVVRSAEKIRAMKSAETRWKEHTAEVTKAKKEADSFDFTKLKLQLSAAQAMHKGEVEVVGIHKNEHQAKCKLSVGEFDGVCPVAQIPCPAKTEILSRKEDIARLAKEASRKLNGASERAEKAAQRLRDAEEEVATARSARERLQALQKREEALSKEVDQAKKFPDPPSHDELDTKITSLIGRMAILTSDRGSALRDLEEVKEAESAIAMAQGSLLGLETDLVTARETSVLFQAAKRKVAETALSSIEEVANTMLAESAIDLELAIKWGYEGKDLAKSCEFCGNPFPSSTKVRECLRCSMPRGQHFINKLIIDLSKQSGAMEDLGGIALQLAAGEWLRKERESGWGVLVLDEPIASLDKAHRRTFSQKIGTLLRQQAEQGFVIAHDAAVLDALPGRILIESDGTYAVPRVIA